MKAVTMKSAFAVMSVLLFQSSKAGHELPIERMPPEPSNVGAAASCKSYPEAFTNCTSISISYLPQPQTHQLEKVSKFCKYNPPGIYCYSGDKEEKGGNSCFPSALIECPQGIIHECHSDYFCGRLSPFYASCVKMPEKQQKEGSGGTEGVVVWGPEPSAALCKKDPSIAETTFTQSTIYWVGNNRCKSPNMAACSTIGGSGTTVSQPQQPPTPIVITVTTTLSFTTTTATTSCTSSMMQQSTTVKAAAAVTTTSKAYY